MKLPNADQALVPEAKITDYLLSPTHPIGRAKASFFTRFGYSLGSWSILATALRRHAADHEVVATGENQYGTRYVIDGILPSPDGRAPLIRSVWFIRTAEQIPHLVTAHPLSREAG